MKRVTILVISVVLFSILSGCNSNKTKSQQSAQQDSIPADEIVLVERFPDLTEGEVELDESCFGEVIDLKGEQKITNEIFKSGKLK